MHRHFGLTHFLRGFPQNNNGYGWGGCNFAKDFKN